MDRQEALDELARFGIFGEKVYLIDLIPLIEMILADGKIHEGEVAVLHLWIQRQIKHINQLAGYTAVTVEDAMRFVDRFLAPGIDPALLVNIRQCIGPLRLANQEGNYSEKLLKRILFGCMEIASASVTDYPYGIGERINRKEKALFLEILETFQEYVPNLTSMEPE